VYRNGLKLVDLASVHLNSVELKTEARPLLRELTARMNLTTHLAILDGLDAVYIDKVDVESSLRLYSQIGRRISVHCSAL
jgi:DNA-binding IclR family transcriptional regulator